MDRNRRTIHTAGAGPFDHLARARSVRCLPRSPIRSDFSDRHALTTTMAAEAGQHHLNAFKPLAPGAGVARPIGPVTAQPGHIGSTGGH